jgi:translation initiation factor 3 subunit I
LDGKVAKFDAKSGEQVKADEGSHTKEITDIQLSPDGTYFITCSRDRTARVSLFVLPLSKMENKLDSD